MIPIDLVILLMFFVIGLDIFFRDRNQRIAKAATSWEKEARRCWRLLDSHDIPFHS